MELLTARVSADDLLAPGSPIDYANDVAVAKSGLIYFTDSTRGVIPVRNAEGFWDTMQAYMLTLYHVRALPTTACYGVSPELEGCKSNLFCLHAHCLCMQMSWRHEEAASCLSSSAMLSSWIILMRWVTSLKSMSGVLDSAQGWHSA